jgi:Helix-turn-helix domain
VPGKTAEEDEERFENRLRAHLRQRMTKRRLTAAAVGPMLGVDPSYISRWLRKGRGGMSGRGGLSARIVWRMVQMLQLNPDDLFFGDPPEQFWRDYVPQGFAEDPNLASPTSPQPTRQAGAGETSEHQNKKAW